MSFRKQRTRTLIQLGGLIEKSGLLDRVNILPGTDLQKDLDCFDAVATLMGAFAEISEALQDDTATAQKYLWCERGKEMLTES